MPVTFLAMRCNVGTCRHAACHVAVESYSKFNKSWSLKHYSEASANYFLKAEIGHIRDFGIALKGWGKGFTLTAIIIILISHI